MRISIRQILFVFLLLLPNLSRTQTVKPRIAVLNLDPVGITAQQSITLSDRLRSELVKTNAFILLERTDMNEILKEQGFQLSGCTSDQCALQAGKLLNVQQICAGSMGKIGQLYTVSVRLIDVESGQVLKTVTEDCPCPLEAVLTKSMRNVALKLAGIIPNRAPTLTGALSVQTEPGGVLIMIDGKSYGQTPKTISALPMGKHTLILQKAHFAPYKQIVDILPQQTQTIAARLKPAATLLISTEPDNAQIWINGQLQGRSPLHLEVPPDSALTIRVQKADYQQAEKKITLKPGQFQELNFTLHPQTGTLYFSKLPPDALIFINGQRISLKKSQILLPFGDYQIQVTSQGFYTKSFKVHLKSNEVKTVNGALIPKTVSGAVFRSAIFPGWGQHYQGKHVRGWLFTLGVLSGTGATFYYYHQYTASKDEYDVERQKYRQAFSNQSIEIYRRRMKEKYDQTDRWHQRTNIAIGLTTAVWLWNILDAAFLPPRIQGTFNAKGMARNGKFSVGFSVLW